MCNLIDIINNNQTLRKWYDYLELGLNTVWRNILLPHLKSLEVDGDVLTKEYIQRLLQQVTDDMLSHNCSRRDIVEMSNVLSIYGQTAITIQSEIVSDKEIDTSWAAKFFDCIKNISNHELQTLWSKILLQELKQPNTYFMRTLEVFHRADKFEIEWFFEITKFVFDKACVPEFILTGNKFYQFNKFQTLVDAGFMNASLGTLSYSETVTIKLVSVDMKIDILKPPFGINIYSLTDAGSQIFDLNCEVAKDEYIDKLKEVIENGDRAKVLSIDRK